ncbi:unnamed protein product [Urochloa humidicola]
MLRADPPPPPLPEVRQIRRHRHRPRFGRSDAATTTAHAISACPAGWGALALPNPAPPPLETVRRVRRVGGLRLHRVGFAALM